MICIETNHGNINIELDFERTPISAQNFLDYVKEGFYDGSIFHRVIDGFMIQGGGFNEDMEQLETREGIENEADKGGANLSGTLAMARTSDPHSATSQFFINVKDNKFLDYKSSTGDAWGYCVFAEVVDGMDVIDKIRKVVTTSKAGHSDVPEQAVIMTKVSVVEEGADLE